MFRLTCSFCRRRDDQVAKLVAGPRMRHVGPRVYICDACVALSAKIMVESGVQQGGTAVRRAGPWRRVFGLCRRPLQLAGLR